MRAIPLWKRINYLLFSLGGSAFGFYVQDRVIQGRLHHLREEVPRLERELEQAIMRRLSLERELERLTGQAVERTWSLHHHFPHYHHHHHH